MHGRTHTHKDQTEHRHTASCREGQKGSTRETEAPSGSVTRSCGRAETSQGWAAATSRPPRPGPRGTHGVEKHREEELAPVDDLVQLAGAAGVLVVEDGVCEEAAGLPREDLGGDGAVAPLAGWRPEGPASDEHRGASSERWPLGHPTAPPAGPLPGGLHSLDGPQARMYRIATWGLPGFLCTHGYPVNRGRHGGPLVPRGPGHPQGSRLGHSSATSPSASEPPPVRVHGLILPREQGAHVSGPESGDAWGAGGQ